MTLLRQIKSIQQSVWWLFAVLAFCSSAAWSAVGYVHEASGEVLAQRGAGAAQPVKAGDTFEPGTTFRTAGDGKVIIKFEDGQLAALQPNTTFRVDQYNYNAKNPKASTSAISLVQGAMRFVTGVIGSTNRNNVRFAAGPTATIGIRGTDVSVLVDQTTQAVLAMVAAGTVLLETPSGSSTVNVGQYSSYAAGIPPTTAQPAAGAPASAQGIINALRAAPIPVNTPVIVASAATAAKAVAEARATQAAANANPGNASLQAAADKAATAANTAISAAVNEALTALTAAINSGAVTPTPAAPSIAAPADTPAPTLVQQVNTIINPPPPTPPPPNCTLSPC